MPSIQADRHRQNTLQSACFLDRFEDRIDETLPTAILIQAFHPRAISMRRLAFMTVLFTIGVSPMASAAEPTFERVFGPEVPTGPYKHPACMTELSNGDLYLVYYGGEGEYANETAVFGSRLAKGSTRWTPPIALARDPFRSVGNGVIWEAPDGVVWLFYVVRYGATWSTSRVQFKISRDHAKTWSDASPLTLEEGMMVRNRPIVLSDGSYLLPLYKETGHDTEKVGAESTSLFFKFDPKAKTWSETGRIRSPKGNIQPAPVEIAKDRIVAYCRRGGGYEPNEIGYIVRSESKDGGKTWSEGADSAFPNPNAAVDFLKLQSGKLLLVYNDSMNRRTPLALAISSDNDKTWPMKRNLVEGPGDFGYPIAFQAKDGKIHVVYTSEKRKVINHAVVDENWVLGGK
jgi:predicted neuraminidase